MDMSVGTIGTNKMNGIRSRIQILFYSALISVMSGLNRIRTRLEPKEKHQAQTSSETLISVPNEIEELVQTPKPGFWARTGQALTAFIVWMILGFSVGFLIGIIQLR